jgi:tetratricopeptide (TPR) repeat protein
MAVMDQTDHVLLVGEGAQRFAGHPLRDVDAQQLGHWKDSEALFRHALAVTENNCLAHNNLSVALEEKGQTDVAIRQYQEAIRLKPDFAEAQNNLGYLWTEHGENLNQARAMIEKAVKLDPKNAGFLDSMGWVLLKLNRPHDALDYLLKAIENSDQPNASLYDHLGDIYAVLNQREKAAEAWRKSLSVQPSRQIQRKLE